MIQLSKTSRELCVPAYFSLTDIVVFKIKNGMRNQENRGKLTLLCQINMNFSPFSKHFDLLSERNRMTNPIDEMKNAR
jgi:hypothetical protein